MGKGQNSLIGAVQAHLRRGAGNVVPVTFISRCRVHVNYTDNSGAPAAIIIVVVGSCETIMAPGYDQTSVKQQVAALLSLSTISGMTITDCSVYEDKK